MNTFNRIVVILLLLATIVVSAIVMAVPQPVIVVLRQQLEFAEILLTPATHLAIIFVGAFLILVCLLLLWLELWRPERKTVRVPQVSGGEAEVSVDSIAQRLRHNVDQLAGVVEVKPTVISRGKGVEVTLDLETSPEVDVPAKTEEVCQVARQVVEERMGMKLHKIRVNIKHAPYPETPKSEVQSPRSEA